MWGSILLSDSGPYRGPVVEKSSPEGSAGLCLGRPPGGRREAENWIFRKCWESLPRAPLGLGEPWGPLGRLWGAVWGLFLGFCGYPSGGPPGPIFPLWICVAAIFLPLPGGSAQRMADAHVRYVRMDHHLDIGFQQQQIHYMNGNV